MTGRLRVQAVRTRRDLTRFIDLPYRLHARDPVWVPPLRRDVKLLLSRTRNPFFEHAEAEYFIAEREGLVLGRIAAISNQLHNETHDDQVGFFGFFESIDDQSVADALLNSAAEWCRQRGHDVLRGPASFSVNDECGLLVAGFEMPPTLMMPHNPRYYIGLLERHGIQPSMSRTGCPYDNAMAESFMKTLKHEEVDGRTYRDLAHVRATVAVFLETVYNRKRLHSALGYKPPADFEAEFSPPVGAAAQQPQLALNSDCP